jgi:hypothetical protein
MYLRNFRAIHNLNDFVSLLLPVGCAIFATTSVANLSMQAANEQGINDQLSLFAAIDALEHSLPFKKETVENITGCKLHVDDSVRIEGGSKDRVEFVSDKSRSGLISKVELTQFEEPSANASGIFSLYFNEDAAITEASIRSRFGKPDLVMSQPVADVSPDTQPNSLNYEKAWGTLIFSVSKSGNHCLQHVILRAIVQPSLPMQKTPGPKSR